MCDENRIVRPAGRHRAEQLHHVQALARVHAVERLVEQQDTRVVDEPPPRSSPAGACPSNRCRSAGPGTSDQVDGLERPRRRGDGIGQPLELRVEERKLPAGQVGMHRLAFRDEPDLAVDRGIQPGRSAEDPDLAVRRPQETGHHVEQGRLARAVGAEETRHAGTATSSRSTRVSLRARPRRDGSPRPQRRGQVDPAPHDGRSLRRRTDEVRVFGRSDLAWIPRSTARSGSSRNARRCIPT